MRDLKLDRVRDPRYAPNVEHLDAAKASYAKVKKLLAERFPNVQMCIPTEGEPYALARVHNVTLISAQAACCIYQRPIAADTNEIGALPALLQELHRSYSRTKLIDMVTTDAGNTSLGVATQIVEELRWHYFSQLKSEHGVLHAEAVRVLAHLPVGESESTSGDKQNGLAVTYHVWRADLSSEGWMKWTHARQLVRVQRVAEGANGTKSVGNRYYVSSRELATLSAEEALRISRGHWRCEEETHWTADVVLGEDHRRLAWSRHPNGVFVIAALRMIALNILAVARKLSRVGETHATPSWRQVAEQFLLTLCTGVLAMGDFDAA